MVLHQVEDVLNNFYQSWNKGYTNFVFKLHYSVSFNLLMIFMIATSIQLFQNNYVNCVGGEGETEERIDNYAYYFSTFTLVEDKDGRSSNDIVKHSYYFWVPVLLVYQLIVFRWTYYVWKGRGGKVLIKLNEDNNETEMFARYIAKRIQYKLNDGWLFQLVFLEFQNILVCVHQWVTTNYVLNGRFYQLGLNLSLKNLDEVFPYTTKFSFQTYGPSGSIQTKDYMCILGLNALYKQVFFLYWWWLVILSALTVLNFAVRITLMIFRPKRCFWERQVEVWLLTYTSWFISLRYPDRVFIKYLHASVSLLKFREVIRHLANPNIRTPSGEDYPSESTSGNNVDLEEKEETIRFRKLLKSIMHPTPTPINQIKIEDDKSGTVGFSPRDHSVSKYREVVLYTFHPVEEEADAYINGPAGEPLLDDVHDSGTDPSKCEDECKVILLNPRRKTIQYSSLKKEME